MDKNELLNELRIDRSAPEPRSGRGGLLVVALVAAMLVLGGGAWFLARPAVAEVRTASVRLVQGPAAQASVLDATGYVTARRQATVSAKITGKVREVLIEEGMRVEEGQVLATLDPTEAEAQLALYRAQADEARAQLGELRTQLGNAERELERQRGLDARQLTSAQALDAAETQVQTLRARLASAQSRVAVAERSVRVAEVGVDNTVVRAPFAGVVTVKAAQPGEMISPISAGGGFTRTGIGTIVDMDSLEVQVDVNESYIGRVQSGQPVEAVLNAYPDWKIPARVIAIIPAADRSKATVRVRIAIEVRDPRIVPDMGVRVAFLEDADAKPESAAPAPPRVLVPVAALRREEGRDVVLLVREGRIVVRPVTLGGTVGDARQATSGLAGGEIVVIEGPADLKDGQEVEPKGA